MSMSVGGGSGLQSEINVTPLVDVVLVLLIIFMVVTPILQMGIDVEVPPKVEVSGPPPTGNQTQLVINIKQDGTYLNSAKMATTQQLRDTIAKALNGRKADDKVVFVISDDRIPFEKAVVAMDAAREAGAMKVGFLTEPPK